MAPPKTVLANTTSLIDQCLADISPITGVQPSGLALDLEGVRLCRHGSISIVQVYADTSSIIWLIDVTTLGREAFDHKDAHGQSLLEVFQNPRTKKLFFDVRNDADALWNIYEINITNVYDLQLLDVASRRSRNIRVKHIKGLTSCIEQYLNPSNEWKVVKDAGKSLFLPEMGGSYAIFEQRPLDARILAYCAQDVALMFQLETAMKRMMGTNGKDWDARIVRESANRVAESKSSFYDGLGKHRAIAPNF